MINCYLDIETIPGQNNRQQFIYSAVDNYKPPSTLTKAKACFDLSYSDKYAKELSKDDAIKLWVDWFGSKAAEANGEHEWRKTALDGTYGEVISIAWAVEDGEIKTRYRHLVDKLDTEEGMITSFFTALEDDLAFKSKRNMDEPFFIGHNIPFDLKFLWRRAVILGIKPPFELPFAGYHGRDYFDNMVEWCGRGERISQDNLCKALGIEGKPEGVTGSTVWDYVKAGKIDEVVTYNIDDVDKVRQIHKRLTFA